MMTVGVVGLGNIGGRVADVLTDAFDVVVFDLDDERVEALVEAGASAAEDGALVGERADVVILSLPGDDALEAATMSPGGILEGLTEGDVLIDTSTVSPSASSRVAEACASAGVDFLDAPVSGGARNAETGDLTVLVGGDEAVLDRVRPVLDAIAGTVHHVGEQGHGVTLKVVNNYMLGQNQLVLAEGLAMARAAGIDDETFTETISDASGNSYALQRNMERFVIPGEYDSEFTLDLMTKDVRIGERFAADNDVSLLLGGGSGVYRLASALGYGDSDASAVVELYREMDGV